MTSYTQKLNAFTPRKTWTIEPTGVRWQDEEKEKKSGFIEWDDIRSVRLRFEPSRAETRRVALHIYTPIQHSITNIHYGGVMNFQLQKDEFERFVSAFHEAIPSETSATFHKGSTMGAWIGNIAITVGILLLLLFLAPLISLTGMPGGTSIFRIVIILIFLPIVFKMLKTNKPETYRPEDWPREMLA